MPGAQARPGPSANPRVELQVEVAGGSRAAPEPEPPTPAATAPGALAWAEVAAGLHPLEQVPESSGPFVSSPETRDADAPDGARRLPEGHPDVAYEPLILPGAPESPAGVDGPWPEAEAEAEAGDEAGPHAGHHGLTLLHPPPPRPEGQAEVPVGRVGAEGPRAAAEEPGRPARPPSRLGDLVATQDGLQSKRSHPGRRGSVVSASDCARRGWKFHFRSRARTWVAGSPLTPCQSPWVRQPVDVSLSHPPPSLPYTPFGDSMEDISSSKRQ
ncbi:LOW QUALITY PROTEIN: hypothetical protein QTO34_003134 [Cnephaeus nilssonii]|uniref:Uncharacterized protein n=1 Tax=Cnephaeus nilssonii TaxID=3371016 RepID=A0AA40HQA9_CNENI|nr:LOW QUALITY PROTEIN: hypothetical protein QTO34_003134 [Eptesicus nilssonii]